MGYLSCMFTRLVQTPWEDVRKEMVDEKGLAPEAADKIKSYVKLAGGKELVDKLQADPTLMGVKDTVTGLDEMKMLLNYCELFGVLDNVSNHLSLGICVVPLSMCVGLGHLKQVVTAHFCVSAFQVSFDLSLARGLDYYTGVIYEAILIGNTLLSYTVVITVLFSRGNSRGC